MFQKWVRALHIHTHYKLLGEQSFTSALNFIVGVDRPEIPKSMAHLKYPKTMSKKNLPPNTYLTIFSIEMKWS